MILLGSELVCGLSQSNSDEGSIGQWVSPREIQVLSLLKRGTQLGDCLFRWPDQICL